MSQTNALHPALRLLTVIIDWEKRDSLADFLREQQARFIFTLPGQGTANSEIMDLLGLGSSEKAVTLCFCKERRLGELVHALCSGFGLARPGRGVAFTLSLSGVSGAVTQVFENSADKGEDDMEAGQEKNREAPHYSLVLSVINQGYSDELMDAAKEAGARGGTVIHARRVASEDAVKFFGITVQPEKEIVAIVTQREKKRAIMEAISHSCGIQTEARGIVISVPVDGFYGFGTEEA